MFHRPKSEEEQVPTQRPDSEARHVSGTETNTPHTEERSSSPEVMTVTATVSNDKPEGTPEMMKTDDNQDRQMMPQRPMDAAPASAHSAFPQRPVQAPRYANPYGAGGMSPGQESPEERKLLIGRGITMSGEIDSCDTLVVEGTVEASLRGARFLDVASTGVFYGAVEIDEANISGRFEGDITVNGRLTITSTGSITGTISYKEMAMEAGAIIDGKISPLGATAGAREEKAGASRKVVKSVGARDGERDANQLPLSSAAA